MKTNLPIHMDAWQDFKHSWLGVATITAVLAIIIIVLIALLTYLIFKKYDGAFSDYDERSLLSVHASAFFCLIFALVSCTFIPINCKGYNPRAQTAYASKNSNVEWKAKGYGLPNLHGQYWSDDYLTFKNANIRIAKTEWSNKKQTVKPINSIGKAWFIVAQKIENSPKPHLNTKIRVYLNRTQGSVETPTGTEKFICYVNNQKDKGENDYQVLDYK